MKTSVIIFSIIMSSLGLGASSAGETILAPIKEIDLKIQDNVSEISPFATELWAYLHITNDTDRALCIDSRFVERDDAMDGMSLFSIFDKYGKELVDYIPPIDFRSPWQEFIVLPPRETYHGRIELLQAHGFYPGTHEYWFKYSFFAPYCSNFENEYFPHDLPFLTTEKVEAAKGSSIVSEVPGVVFTTGRIDFEFTFNPHAQY